MGQPSKTRPPGASRIPLPHARPTGIPRPAKTQEARTSFLSPREKWVGPTKPLQLGPKYQLHDPGVTIATPAGQGTPRLSQPRSTVSRLATKRGTPAGQAGGTKPLVIQSSGSKLPLPKMVGGTTKISSRPASGLSTPCAANFATSRPAGAAVRTEPEGPAQTSDTTVSKARFLPLVGSKISTALPIAPPSNSRHASLSSETSSKYSSASSLARARPAPTGSSYRPVSSTPRAAQQSLPRLSKRASITSHSSYSTAPRSGSSTLTASTTTIRTVSSSSSFPPPFPYVTNNAHAPYLVPSQGPPVTLEWEQDPECLIPDEADELWKELEAKMGRRLRGASMSERGRWVVKVNDLFKEDVKPLLCENATSEAGQGTRIFGDVYQSEEMDRTPSDFSISAYFVEPPMEATALFDMSAPLVPSVSSSAATPQNTPCIRNDTLRRVRRVAKKRTVEDISDDMRRDGSYESDDAGECPIPSLQIPSPGMSYSDLIGSTPDIDIRHITTTSPDILPIEPIINDASTTESASGSSSMYKLDSHIVSALAALSSIGDSPSLDVALGYGASPLTTSNLKLHNHMTSNPGELVGELPRTSGVSPLSDHMDALSSPIMHGEGGLGLGIHIRLDSVYHLPTIARPTRSWAAPGDDDSDIEDGVEGDAESWFMVKNLDTGEMREIEVRD